MSFELTMFNALRLQLTFGTFEYMDAAGVSQGTNHAGANTAVWKTVLLPSISSIWFSYTTQNERSFVSFY